MAQTREQRAAALHQLHPCRVYKAVGFDDEDLARPTIGIANAFSDIVPGHSHLRQVAEFVKKGVHLAGATRWSSASSAAATAWATARWAGITSCPPGR